MCSLNKTVQIVQLSVEAGNVSLPDSEIKDVLLCNKFHRIKFQNENETDIFVEDSFSLILSEV